MLLVFYLALRWTSYERLSSPAHLTQNEASPSTQLDLAQRLGYMVVLASNLHILPMTCLVRGLALQWLLLRRGILAQLCIGANKSMDGLHAHAWVEVQGHAISETAGIVEKFHMLVPGGHALP